MVNRSAEFTVRRGNCAMTFECGPKKPFAFSTKDAKISINVARTFRLPTNLVLESAPTIMWNEKSGEVRIRNSLRVVDNNNRPLDTALYVARVLELKAGQYVFDEPWNGPGPGDLTLQFSRPHDATWTAPVVDVEGLPAWTSQSLASSKHLKCWGDVSEIRVTFHGGQGNRFLPMDRILACREQANKTLLEEPTSAPSSSWRSSAGGHSSLAAPRQTFSLSTKASGPKHLGGKEDQKDSDSMVETLTKPSTENHSDLLAEALSVGHEGQSRYYEDNLWTMVLGATTEDEEGWTKVDGSE